MATKVDNLDLDRPLANWRWLCPTATLVARNVFGELFLADENGKVFWLNVTVGTLTQIAGSLAEFHDFRCLEQLLFHCFTATLRRSSTFIPLHP